MVWVEERLKQTAFRLNQSQGFGGLAKEKSCKDITVIEKMTGHNVTVAYKSCLKRNS